MAKESLAPKGLSVMIGLGKPKKKSNSSLNDDMEHGDEEEEYEDNPEDAAISEMIELFNQGDVEGARSAFKDVFELMHTKAHAEEDF